MRKALDNKMMTGRHQKYKKLRKAERNNAAWARPGVGDLFMLEGRINLAVID